MSIKSRNISTPTFFRCQHHFANGMRCSLPTRAEDVLFCPRHVRLAENQPVEEDHSKFLLKSSQHFQTAQGVNFALANLFELVAKNRISPRRAAVLAYIGSLLLRTHSSIDSDREAGITDPTKLKPAQPAPESAKTENNVAQNDLPTNEYTN